jgi:uncharacterized protein with von Willebrand factor type A (vWA) domain
LNGPILGFLDAARNAGIRISVAESIDAFHAVDAVGVADRDALKDALAVVLAKSREEKELFELCFELYFSRGGFAGAPDPATQRVGPRGGETALERMLTEGDRAGLAVALEAAGARSGVSRIRFSTQTNMFVHQIMQELGADDLAREIARLREAGDDGGADALERAMEYLRAQVRAFVERQLALAAPGERRWRDENLKTATLWKLDRRDIERMRVLVRALAARLATRYGRDRRHRRRGRLDVRRTLRRNTGHGGVPFVTVWKRRAVDKPRIMALCDVSGSVAPVAQFLLLFLHSLNEAVSDIRSFAFSSRLVEVTGILEAEPVETAIARIVRDIGFRSTDYGRSLADFADGWLDRVHGTTTVIIMGDARSNYSDPRVDVMRTLNERAKRVIWLNPESRSSWGTGDSEMMRYLPFCQVARECSTARDLERTIADLLSAR